MNLWIEAMSVAAEIGLILYFFPNFFSEQDKYDLFPSCVFVVLFVLADFLLYLLPLVSALHTLLAVVITYLFVKLYFRQPWLSSLYAAFLYLAASIASDVICGAVLMVTGVNSDALLGDGAARAVYIAMGKLLHLLCLFVILTMTKRRYSYKVILRTLPLWMCLLFSLFVCYHNYTALLAGASAAVVIVETVGLLFINLVICIYVEVLDRTYARQQEAILAQQQLQLRECYYQDLVERQEETRALWHDIKKYMSAMELLVDQDKRAEARACLDGLQRSFEQAQNIFNTGNPTVDSILAYGLKKAEEAQTKLRCQTWIDSRLEIPASDLFVIIGNTLDNAVEACGALPEGDARWIDVSLTQKNHLLRYEIRNPYVPLTPREKKRIHGYGLKNVATCVQRHNGTMTVMKEDGYYTVLIVLNV